MCSMFRSGAWGITCWCDNDGGAFHWILRTDALKISAVLAIPVIAISVALELALLTSYAKDFYLDLLFVTFGSLISAYFSLHLFFGIIEKLGMLPFLIYRLFLGAFIIAFFYL